MLWTFAAAGGMGLVLGLWSRVPALIAASCLTAATCLSLAPFMDMGLLSALVFTFASLGVLQVGYLAGLILFCAWSRARLSPADLPMLGNGEPLGRGGPRAR